MQNRSLIGFALALVLIAGCGGEAAPAPAADPTTPTASGNVPISETPAGRMRDWLRGEPCATPCLLGITPGTSTQTETLGLIHSQYPALAPSKQRSTDSNPSYLSWNWGDSARPAGLAAYYYETPPKFVDAPVDTVISVIGSLPQPMPLSEVIDTLGEPSHILAFAYDLGRPGAWHQLAAVWLDRGAMVIIDNGDGLKIPVLAPEAPLRDVMVFPATVQGFDTGLSALFPMRAPSELLTPWRGYQPFAAYCRESGPKPDQPLCPEP